MFQLGESHEFNVGEPYLVAKIENGKHAGKWGIFTTNTKSRRASNNFFLQEARPTKREAMARADEMRPAVGGPSGVVVLNEDGSYHKFLPEDNTWESYAKFALAAFNETKYGGDQE